MNREKVRVLGLRARDAAECGDFTEAARVLDLALAEFNPRRSPTATRALDRLQLLRAKAAVSKGQTFVLPERWSVPLPDEQRPRPRKGVDAAGVQSRPRRRGASPASEASGAEPAGGRSWPRVPLRRASRPVGSKTVRVRGRRELPPADLPGLAGGWLGARPPTKVNSVVSAGAMETDRHRH